MIGGSIRLSPYPDTFRMSNFRLIDRDTGFLMPPSVDEWLPERHLARFVVEVITGLDLRVMTGSYRGSGAGPFSSDYAVPRASSWSKLTALV